MSYTHCEPTVVAQFILTLAGHLPAYGWCSTTTHHTAVPHLENQFCNKCQ